MPTYRVRLSDGRTVTVKGDQPPTEQDVLASLGESGAPAEAEAQPEGRSWTDTIINALPTAGGAIGGLVGKLPVVGSALAGIGGAAGEGYRQVAESLRGNWENVPETMGGRIRSMAQAGATQAGAELGGAGIARGLQTVGRGVVRSLLKPSMSARMRPRANTITNTVVENWLPQTDAGIKKAGQGIGRSVSEAGRATRAATGSLDPYNPALRTLRWAGAKFNRPGARATDFDAANRVVNEFLDKAPASMTVPQVSAAKTALQEAAKTYGVEGPAAQTTQKVLGANLKRFVERAAPGVKDANRQASRLIDAKGALEAAVARHKQQMFDPRSLPNLFTAGAGVGQYAQGRDTPTTLGTMAATRTLMAPAVMSRVGLGLAHTPQAMMSNAIRAALLAAMQDQGQEP